MAFYVLLAWCDGFNICFPDSKTGFWIRSCRTCFRWRMWSQRSSDAPESRIRQTKITKQTRRQQGKRTGLANFFKKYYNFFHSIFQTNYSRHSVTGPLVTRNILLPDFFWVVSTILFRVVFCPFLYSRACSYHIMFSLWRHNSPEFLFFMSNL